MNKGIRYTDSFKHEAVNQIVKHGYPVNEVPFDWECRLNVCTSG